MPLANSTLNNRVTQSGPLTVDASFQFVDVRDLGTIVSFLKHTPHGVVNWIEDRVEDRWVRRPESGWDNIGRLLVQHAALLCLWRDVMGHCPAEKWKTHFQMLHECQEAASVSKQRHDNMPHWFSLLVPGRECYWHRDWTLHASATETITDMLKFDLVFSRRVALMSLFLVAVETVVCSMILWSHNYFLSGRMRYQYEFIVVNGQTTTSTFHKVV